MENVAKRGIDIQLKIGVELLAMQRGATLNQSTDTIETTNKLTGGWKTFEPSFKEWSIDCDGLIPVDSTAFKALQESYRNGEKLTVSLLDKEEKGETGSVIISDFPLEYPYDDSATYSITLQGTGALEEVKGV